MIKWYLPKRWREPTTIYHYALAIVSVAVAIVAAELITRLLNAEAIASSMLCAVIFTAWFGGFGPALLAIALAVLSFHYYLVPPINSFTWKHDLFGVGISEVPRLILFSIVSILIAFLISAQRKITETLRRSRDELRTAIADQKRMEATLQSAFDEIKRSEDRLRLVIDTIPTLVWRAGSDGAAEFLNQRCLDYTGLSLDQALEWGWAGAIHPDDREGILETWRAIRMWRTRGETEARLRRFDGEYRWFLFRIEPLHDEGGNIVEWYASGTDIEDRKQTENALRQSEVYLAQAQRLSLSGTFGWRVASGENTWSTETYRIFGYDEASAANVGMVVARAHPEDRAAVQNAIDRCSVDGNDYDQEYRLLMPDGSVKYVHAVARAERGASGNLEYVGAVTDVTVAREVERQLRRSEAYLAEAQRLSHTSSWAWDVRRREFVYRSPEAYHLMGLDPIRDAVSQQPLWDRVHLEDRDRVIETARQAIREKTDFEVEYRIDRPDGSMRYVHSVGHPVFGDGGEEIELIVGTHVDITEQQLAREMLQKAFDEIKKSEDRLRLVIDTIPTLVWRAGPDGVPDFLNQPALDYTGLSLDQAETGWPRAFHPDDKKGMLVKWTAIRQSGKPGGLEARLRRFDGRYRWFLFEAVPLHDEAGNIVKWYGSSTDIEDRKRAEEGLRKAQAELAHVTRVTMLGEMTASISHEINQPLTAVVTNAEACLRWLGRETPNLEAARRSVEWIISDGNRASQVMRRVRALAKKSTIEKVPLNINDLVRETVALVQHELISHQVLLRTELASNLPMVEADRVQLQQVIINLVMNGIEAMQPVVDRLRELVIRSLRDEAPQVLVSVADCGVGISAENADRLFNAFFTTKPSGMGMGLSICRSIVEAHGGRLWSTGNLPHGATFHFTLPVRADLASDPHAVELPAADVSGS